MKAKILDIFQSIQGEGIYAGRKQGFIRFFECNMHCVWCDTPHSIGNTSSNYSEYTLDETMDEIKKFDQNCHSISLTGGEPLLQKGFIKKLLPKIQGLKIKSYLETNGIFYDELDDIIDDIDIIAMDIKLPSSTKCRSYWDEHKKFLDIASKKEVFVKTVISSETEKDDIDKSVELITNINPQAVFILQPNTYDLGNGVMNKCFDFYNYSLKYLTDVRILPQMHKMMKIR